MEKWSCSQVIEKLPITVCLFFASPSAVEWNTWNVVDSKTKLHIRLYVDNPTEYGKLWDPTTGDEAKVDRMIALSLQVARLNHNMQGVVM